MIGKRELELRPRLRPGDILEAVPGLFAVQHAGGGKANQYFLRGFDADHGTDVAFSVDGVPINMVSHGHGQGFTDFHFLIPELVTSLDGYKGPFYASQGDFATAGAVNLHLAETFEESFAQYSIGQYGIMRALVVESPDLGDDWRAVVAGELYKDDGPFLNPEQRKRYNVYLKATHDLGRAAKVQRTAPRDLALVSQVAHLLAVLSILLFGFFLAMRHATDPGGRGGRSSQIRALLPPGEGLG